jgi:hypothetical protein
MSYFTLSTGKKIPTIGMGTFTGTRATQQASEPLPGRPAASRPSPLAFADPFGQPLAP